MIQRVTVKTPETMSINDRELPAMRHQVRFLNMRVRNPLLVGGYGAGKSHGLIRKALQGAAENPGLIGIYACLTYPVLRDAILPELWQILAAYDLQEGRDWTYHGSSFTLTLHLFADADGKPAKIYFRPVEGAENLRRLIATTAAWACLDEAALMSEEAYEKVTARVRDRRARHPFIAAATTPEGLNWLYRQWAVEPRRRAREAGVYDGLLPDEPFRLVRGRTQDNPHLDPGYVDALLRQYDETLVRAYVEGRFVPLLEGLCFSFSEALHVTTQADYDPKAEIRMGWDFNVNPMSVSLNHWDGRKLWTFDELTVKTSHTDEVCDIFLDRYGDHRGGVVVHGDASGRSRSTKSRNTDYDIIGARLRHMDGYREDVPTANPSQRDSINGLNGLLRNSRGRIGYQVHPRCVEVINSLQNTRYEEGTGKIAKDEGLEHHSDNLRYVSWAVAPVDQTLRRVERSKNPVAARLARQNQLR